MQASDDMYEKLSGFYILATRNRQSHVIDQFFIFNERIGLLIHGYCRQISTEMQIAHANDKITFLIHKYY